MASQPLNRTATQDNEEAGPCLGAAMWVPRSRGKKKSYPWHNEALGGSSVGAQLFPGVPGGKGGGQGCDKLDSCPQLCILSVVWCKFSPTKRSYSRAGSRRDSEAHKYVLKRAHAQFVVLTSCASPIIRTCADLLEFASCASSRDVSTTLR